jgi:hypothetical protein
MKVKLLYFVFPAMSLFTIIAFEHASVANDVCELIKKSSIQTLVDPCSVGSTTVPVDSEGNMWAAIGTMAYPAAATKMNNDNPKFVYLNSDQKDFLRPLFGSLVDKVRIHYASVLMDELSVKNLTIVGVLVPGNPQSGPKIPLNKTGAQTYGYDIYLSDSYDPHSNQLVLIAHEMRHTLQFIQRSESLTLFGKDYFVNYNRAGNYHDNVMEAEARATEEQAKKSIYKLAFNNCAARFFDGNCPEESKPQDNFYFPNYSSSQSGVPSFSLDGQSNSDSFSRTEVSSLRLSQEDTRNLISALNSLSNLQARPQASSFGAIGIGQVGNKRYYGWSSNSSSLEDATSLALRSCGQTNCKAYGGSNGFTSIAVSNDFFWGIGTSNSANGSRDNASKFCRQSSGVPDTCQVVLVIDHKNGVVFKDLR